VRVHGESAHLVSSVRALSSKKKTYVERRRELYDA